MTRSGESEFGTITIDDIAVEPKTAMLARMRTSRLYFAYGSNLNRPDWESYCGQRNLSPAGLVFVRHAWLPNFEVSFRYRSNTRGGGALTIHPRPGTAVPGALYDVDDATWDILDGKEGLAQGRYARISCVALDENGAEWPCITYQVTPAFETEEPIAPAPGYFEGVGEALREFDLPTAQLDAAALGQTPAPLPGHLFTYGTLLQDECRWPAISQATAGEAIPASCPGQLLDLGDYPGLVNGRDGERIQGELVRMTSTEAWLDEIDAVEEFRGYGEPGSSYRRVIRRVESSRGPFHAWTYLYLGSRTNFRPIVGGDWRKRTS